MRENPCRYCALHIQIRNRYTHSMLDSRCMACEEFKKHQEYLKSHRKFEQGEVITDINQLLGETWVMMFGRPKHIAALKNMQLGTLLHFISSRMIYKAIDKTKIGQSS